MLSRLRDALRRRTLRSRERRAGKIAQDAAGRAKELQDRGRTEATHLHTDRPDTGGWF